MWLVSMADGAVEIYDVETGEKICRVQGAVVAISKMSSYPSRIKISQLCCQLPVGDATRCLNPMLRQPAACPQRHLVAEQPTGAGSLWPYSSDLRCEEGTENLGSK